MWSLLDTLFMWSPPHHVLGFWWRRETLRVRWWCPSRSRRCPSYRSKRSLNLFLRKALIRWKKRFNPHLMEALICCPRGSYAQSRRSLNTLTEEALEAVMEKSIRSKKKAHHSNNHAVSYFRQCISIHERLCPEDILEDSWHQSSEAQPNMSSPC